MVSLPVGVDDLDELPDHTDQLEKIDRNPAVDGILPRHLGNAELGRFVPGFTLISDRTVQFHCLTESEDGFSFEKLYEFEASEEVEVWKSLWEGKVAFHWNDHDEALTLRGFELAYISRFTLNRPVPEYDDMTEWAKANLTITQEPELPDCNHSHEAFETVPKLPLEVASCPDCGMPVKARYNSSSVGPWESFLVDPWWEFSESRVFETEGLSFVDKRSDTPVTLTDIAVHLLSRAGHVEHAAFDHYLGDYNTMAVIDDEDIAGSLSWSVIHGRTVLQSVYVRPEFRRRDIARLLVEAWYDFVCPSETYFASEPNKGGMAVLESVGHIEKEVVAPVRMHSASDIVDDPNEVAPGQIN